MSDIIQIQIIQCKTNSQEIIIEDKPANTITKSTMILIIILVLLLTPNECRPIKSGTSFELECPFVGVKSIPNIRTYALLLNSAQKNMEVSIYHHGDSLPVQKIQQKISEGGQTHDQQKENDKMQSNKYQQKQILPECILNRNNKICMFDGFIRELKFVCSSSGSVNILIFEPEVVMEIGEDQSLREQAIAPILRDGEKGVVVFKPDGNFEAEKISNQELFISNCIQSIQYFQHEILLGIKGTPSLQVIITSEGVTGSWTFKKIQKMLNQRSHSHLIKAYNLPQEEADFDIINEQITPGKIQKEYHGFKMLLRTENRQLLEKIAFNFTVVLDLNDPIISQKQSLNRLISIRAGELSGNGPVKLAFFFLEHPLKAIKISSNQIIHYILQLSEERVGDESQKVQLPVIEQNQYMYYSYEKLKSSQIHVQAHIQKSFRTKSTPALKIISSGIKLISGQYKKTHKSSVQLRNEISIENAIGGQARQQIVPIVVQNNRILPITINDNNPYAELQLIVITNSSKENEEKNMKTINKKQHQDLYFKLMLETSYIPTQIQIGNEITEFLFENQIKRFSVSKEKMEAVKSKKLIIKCFQCHAFATYKSNCMDISCCEVAHADQIDVKPANLLIIITAASHLEQTALVRLQLIEDEQAFKLKGGELIEATLTESDTYIYETDGKEDIEIICNSQTQAILLLVSIDKNEFPTKTSFDFQSNEGYIRIPATKSKKIIYIRLLKMSTLQYAFYPIYKLSYSFVIASESQKIKLIQGKPLNYIIGKNGQKQYLIQHPCNENTQESIFIKINRQNHLINNINAAEVSGNTGTFKLQIREVNSSKILSAHSASEEAVIDLTKFLIKGNRKTLNHINSENERGLKFLQDFDTTNLICQVVVSLKNLVSEVFDLGIMFFKQRQRYEILNGQFVVDHITADHGLYLYCVIDPSKTTNIYAYSMKEQIIMKSSMLSLKELKEIPQIIQLQENQGKQRARKPSLNYRVIYQKQYETPAYSQYIFFKPAVEAIGQKPKDLTVILIKIEKTQKFTNFERKDIYIICTQNNTVLREGNRLHYRLKNNESHNFIYPLNEVFIFEEKYKVLYSRPILKDKQIILQTTKLDGKYTVRVNLKYFGEIIHTFQLEKQSNSQKNTKNMISQQLINQQEPILILKTQRIKQKLEEFMKNHLFEKLNEKSKDENGNSIAASYKPTKKEEISFKDLKVQFLLTCYKALDKYCTFLTSIQTSFSEIRQLTPGIPQIFHINKHSSVIFIYSNNLHDREFKFKINRKLGLPNYKLCSYRPPKNNKYKKSDGQRLDKCLAQLQNPINQDLSIQKDAFNADPNMIVGRTHQLIINQYNEQYCTNCTYYLGLYSGYVVVQGSIFVMSANQPTLLEESSSITTIVYRGEPDKYMLANWESLMGLIYEIEGKVSIQVYYFDQKNVKHIIMTKGQPSGQKNIQNKEDQNDSANKSQTKKNIIAINLKGFQTQFEKSTKNETDQQLKFYINIQPANNSPSALYTFIVISKDDHIINIKDGVPYEMKYSSENSTSINPIIKYRYRCQTEGIIMISTRDFDDIDIEVRCYDQPTNAIGKDGSKGNSTNQLDSVGKIIDITDLLKTRKSYKMSNRFDINIRPDVCQRYEIMITAKNPTASYSILISSTDIITLPMYKQVPGILKYQTKLYQIYEISVNEKTEVRCTFKFCQGGDGRIMIANSKKSLYQQIYEEQVQIYGDSSYQTLKYMAKPGLFYIKVQFKGRGGILQYTIHVEGINSNPNLQSPALYSSRSPLRMYKNMNTISYKVKRVGFNFTEYEIQFYPILHNENIYEIEYYIVQSTKLKLLKKTQNCNGQYFVEFVNHHEQIKETKINLKNNEEKQQEKKEDNEKIKKEKDNLLENKENQIDDEEEQLVEVQEQTQKQIKFVYSTSTPYTFVTIIPIVYNKNTHEFYHFYVPKYHEVQLKNGQVFAGLTFILGEIASKIEMVVDIHGSEKAILIILIVIMCGCMGSLVLGGIWVGAHYFMRTNTVYVFKELKQEQMRDQHEQNEDNRIDDNIGMASSVEMMRQEFNNGNQNHIQNIPHNQTDISQTIENSIEKQQKIQQQNITDGNEIEIQEKMEQSN